MIKKFSLLFAVAILIICGCSKNNYIAPVGSFKTVLRDAGFIPFKVIPLADNQLKIEFQKTEISLTKVILRQDTAILAAIALSNDPNGFVSATFNYPFKSGVNYNFLIQSPAGTDTINEYKVQSYVHQYVKKYNYQQVLALKQSLGPDGFDLSPSRRFLFIQDDINNKVQTRKIDLQTLAITNVDLDFTGSPIRAVSDNELLAFGNSSTSGIPSPADQGNDAIVLAKYDINTKQSVFVNFVSSGYGRISRIVNNRVLVTNPIFTAKTASLINLGDFSTIKYSLNNFDFTAIDEYSFGHLIYQSKEIINPADGSMNLPLQLNQDAGLSDIDDATGYAFAVNAINGPNNTYLNGISVYKNNANVYQSDYKSGRSDYFPIIYNINNNVVTFYRHFGFDTVANLDGYYTLNLTNGEIKLVQTDSNGYIVSDYQQQDGSIFSIRNDGVYKLTVAP